MLVGLLVGGGGTYLALEKPWATQESTSEASLDAGPAKPSKDKKKKKKRRKRRSKAPTGDEIPVLTDADRKLISKGDRVELPTKSVDMAGEGGGRALSGSEINDTIRSRSKPMIRCINDATGNAPLKAQVTLKLLVGPDGRVQKSRVRAPAYLFDHGFYDCARGAARELVFPATGAHTVVTAPFDIY
jgi:hypothetical protein